MARTTTITNEQLLQAARDEFLEHGIRATTDAIARRAGVSSGILFQRFGSKEALFNAAMNVGNEIVERPLRGDLESRVGKYTVQKNLTDVGENLLNIFYITVPNQLMSWANPGIESQESMADQYRRRGVRGQRALVEYLQAEAALKRIRPVDPYTVAQTFGGALWFFAFEQISGAKLREKGESPSRREFVQRLVDMLWKGLCP